MDIGEFLLALSFVAIFSSSVSFYIGLRVKRERYLLIGEWSVYVSFLAILFASLLLLSHLLSRDFTYIYVYKNSDSHLPLIFTVSAFWAGKEGSLLLWALLITLFNIFTISEKKDKLTALTLILNNTFLMFLNFLLLTSSNPFLRGDFTEGIGLNPLLRTFEMVIHPPVVFLSYSGFLVPFSMVVSGLILGREWYEMAVRRMEKYFFISWILLSAGIFIGALWAYKTLGWGGFWGWDPVENASLFPWLTATLLIHMRYLKRGLYLPLSYALTVTTFIFIVFASVISRGGFISSQHAFGEGEGWIFSLVGVIIAFLTILIFLLRRGEIVRMERPNLSFSRESVTILFLVLSIVYLISVFTGTISPLILQNSPDKEYYESISLLVFMFIMAFFGLCVRLTSGKHGWRDEVEKFKVPSIIGLIVFLSAVAISKDVVISIFAFLAVFSLLNHIVKLYLRKSFYTTFLIHIGVILLFLGAISIWDYSAKDTASLSLNQSIDVGGYSFKIVDVRGFERHDSFKLSAIVEVSKNGEFYNYLQPSLIEYKIKNPRRIASEIAIMSFPTEDIYISLTGVSRGFDSFGLEIHINRLPILLWSGMLLILTGSGISWFNSQLNSRSSFQERKKRE
jgi:cytochrome c-type biogenesis protein CcmF